jgi:hypothetical protein
LRRFVTLCPVPWRAVSVIAGHRGRIGNTTK